MPDHVKLELELQVSSKLQQPKVKQAGSFLAILALLTSLMCELPGFDTLLLVVVSSLKAIVATPAFIVLVSPSEVCKPVLPISIRQAQACTVLIDIDVLPALLFNLVLLSKRVSLCDWRRPRPSGEICVADPHTHTRP